MSNTTATLTAVDRCDGCGAQAYVRVDMHGTDLRFCAHHYRDHSDALAAQGAVVVEDFTDLLTLEGAGS